MSDTEANLVTFHNVGYVRLCWTIFEN